ncbi:phage head-tail joining protein [Pseudomonas sp. SP16.1]|uniref:phage head-tail joining protein n=1 Tax=Pseudomonas sp. SP16.1 TaxID=3458854 RepID=UPI004046087B
MAYTLEQYQALQAAIAGGELSVRYADRSVTYRSVSEMLQILRLMENELGLNTDTTGGRRLTSFSKGY